MKVIRVDQEIQNENSVRFAYECEFGYLEYVEVDSVEVTISSEEGSQDEEYVVQKEDIPKLIKALQAAYYHMNK